MRAAQFVVLVFMMLGAFGLGVSLVMMSQYKQGFIAGAEYMRHNTKCEIVK